MKRETEPEVAAALLAAQFARQIGLPPGNCWEPEIAARIASELAGEPAAVVACKWRARLGLPETAADRLLARLEKWQYELPRIMCVSRWGDTRRFRSDTAKIKRRQFLVERIAAAKRKLGFPAS